jgi:hypothetical protein
MRDKECIYKSRPVLMPPGARLFPHRGGVLRVAADGVGFGGFVRSQRAPGVGPEKEVGKRCCVGEPCEVRDTLR